MPQRAQVGDPIAYDSRQVAVGDESDLVEVYFLLRGVFFGPCNHGMATAKVQVGENVAEVRQQVLVFEILYVVLGELFHTEAQG